MPEKQSVYFPEHWLWRSVLWCLYCISLPPPAKLEGWVEAERFQSTLHLPALTVWHSSSDCRCGTGEYLISHRDERLPQLRYLVEESKWWTDKTEICDSLRHMIPLQSLQSCRLRAFRHRLTLFCLQISSNNLRQIHTPAGTVWEAPGETAWQQGQNLLRRDYTQPGTPLATHPEGLQSHELGAKESTVQLCPRRAYGSLLLISKFLA